jgi:hypothetical protein
MNTAWQSTLLVDTMILSVDVVWLRVWCCRQSQLFDDLCWDEVLLSSAISNKMQRGPLHPHLWIKKCSPSSGSFGSFGLIVVVATIAVGSALMISHLPIFLESDSKLGFGSLSLISATNECFEWHSSVLFQMILWKSHHFLVSLFVFLWPFFSSGLD